MSTPVTLNGRFTRDPELMFSGAGNQIAKFAVVTSRRTLNKTSNEWEETDTSFWDCTAFGKLAENVLESCTKGTLVIVFGRAKQENWEKDGQKRSKVVVIADEVAVSLKWDQVQVIKAEARQPAMSGKSKGTDEPPF
jgi:single-strand DNA-binding protein